MRRQSFSTRVLALGVTLTLVWPSSAFALRKSQETRDPVALATVLRPLPLTPAAGLEEGKLAGRLKRWDGVRFLLVDNPPGTLSLSRALLEDQCRKLGISVTIETAGTFQDTLALLKQGFYGVAILDYDLDQGHKGTEIAAIIRQHSSKTRIILQTSYPRNTVRDQVPALDRLLDGFVDKLGTDPTPADQIVHLLADLAPAGGLEEPTIALSIMDASLWLNFLRDKLRPRLREMGATRVWFTGEGLAADTAGLSRAPLGFPDDLSRLYAPGSLLKLLGEQRLALGLAMHPDDPIGWGQVWQVLDPRVFQRNLSASRPTTTAGSFVMRNAAGEALNDLQASWTAERELTIRSVASAIVTGDPAQPPEAAARVSELLRRLMASKAETRKFSELEIAIVGQSLQRQWPGLATLIGTLAAPLQARVRLDSDEAAQRVALVEALKRQAVQQQTMIMWSYLGQRAEHLEFLRLEGEVDWRDGHPRLSETHSGPVHVGDPHLFLLTLLYDHLRLPFDTLTQDELTQFCRDLHLLAQA